MKVAFGKISVWSNQNLSQGPVKTQAVSHRQAPVAKSMLDWGYFVVF